MNSTHLFLKNDILQDGIWINWLFLVYFSNSPSFFATFYFFLKYFFFLVNIFSMFWYLYIPNKPSKYGIKILMVCHSGSKYIVHAMPYLGKGTFPQQDEFTVMELTKSIHGSNRNKTVDNWFTTVPLSPAVKSFSSTSKFNFGWYSDGMT